MRNVHIFPSLIALFLSCKNQEKPLQVFDNQKNRKFIASEYRNKFKYYNLTKFEIDDLPFGQRNQFYQQADSAFLSLIFKKEIPLHEIWLYHATFQDPSLITLLEESDEYGPIIWLIKFDENGQFSDKTIIAMSKGDAGDTWQRKGVFDGKNTFIVTSIYKIWNQERTKAFDIHATYDSIIFEHDTFRKVPIYQK